jgi:hypothetical protein
MTLLMAAYAYLQARYWEAHTHMYVSAVGTGVLIMVSLSPI